jgi:hypothetical protein
MPQTVHLPTLYKLRGVSNKQPVCAICVDRTRGRTQRVQLSHRVSVWLCAGHASPAFQAQRGGRDFVRTLAGVWRASDCLTAARSRALAAHLERLADHPSRPRPGSYAWPELRRELEDGYAAGGTPVQARGLVDTGDTTCRAHPPSRRTLQRWHAQRRWLVRPP